MRFGISVKVGIWKQKQLFYKKFKKVQKKWSKIGSRKVRIVTLKATFRASFFGTPKNPCFKVPVDSSMRDTSIWSRFSIEVNLRGGCSRTFTLEGAEHWVLGLWIYFLVRWKGLGKLVFFAFFILVLLDLIGSVHLIEGSIDFKNADFSGKMVLSR